MKNKENVNVKIEYGEQNLKEIIVELLKQKYIEYITKNHK